VITHISRKAVSVRGDMPIDGCISRATAPCHARRDARVRPKPEMWVITRPSALPIVLHTIPVLPPGSQYKRGPDRFALSCTYSPLFIWLAVCRLFGANGICTLLLSYQTCYLLPTQNSVSLTLLSALRLSGTQQSAVQTGILLSEHIEGPAGRGECPLKLHPVLPAFVPDLGVQGRCTGCRRPVHLPCTPTASSPGLLLWPWKVRDP
jgi:hypothetical protein